MEKNIKNYSFPPAELGYEAEPKILILVSKA